MNKVLIIAEAGVNHNGSLVVAKKLIDVASEAKADYVKFQSFKSSKLVSKYAPKANYQKKNTDKNESQLDMIKKLELSDEDHLELIDYCKLKDIGFLSSPFDVESIGFLDSLGIDFFKVPSGEITNLPYLQELSKFDKKIVLSTGMSNLDEVKDALEILNGKEVIVLHCNTEYPTPMSDVNLKAMLTIKDSCNVRVGYSDHTLGIEVSIAAVAMGAEVIEKHFTIDKNAEGPDHKASLSPCELKAMVTAIRNVEKSMGDGNKVASESEQKNILIARKSIVAKTKIEKGDIFSEDNITTKRPGTGISPMEWKNVIGRTAMTSFAEDELIKL